MKAIGLILIIAGILMMVLREFTFQKKEKIVDVGPLEINKTENKTVGLPLYAGAITTAAGVVILLTSRKKN